MQAPTFPKRVECQGNHKVGVGSEIIDFTSCPPTWIMTSIIAPCERWRTLPTGFSVLPAHAELNAPKNCHCSPAVPWSNLGISNGYRPGRRCAVIVLGCRVTGAGLCH